MDKENKIELETVKAAPDAVKDEFVPTADALLSFVARYKGCGDRVSYSLRANGRTNTGKRYVVQAGDGGAKLAYQLVVADGESPKTAVVDVPEGGTHTLADPLTSLLVDDRMGVGFCKVVRLSVLGTHRLWVLPDQVGDTAQMLYDWNDTAGSPGPREDGTGLPLHRKSMKLMLDNAVPVTETFYVPRSLEARSLVRPASAETKRPKEPAVEHECGHACECHAAGSVEAGKVLSDEVVHLATTKAKVAARLKAEAPRRDEENSRRNDVLFHKGGAKQCTVYDTREGERWVFFSHNAMARISPLCAKSDIALAGNTFCAGFTKFREGTDIPYETVDGGALWAVSGPHSAVVLNGPVIDGSKLFQVYPSRVEGDCDSWDMIYARPNRYRLLVVPMEGGAVVRLVHDGKVEPCRDSAAVLYDGGLPFVEPVVLPGAYDSIEVLSGSCMVFALHDSLNCSMEQAMGCTPFRALRAEVGGDDKTVWLPILHHNMFQWNRETRDASFVHHLCIGIPHDIAPDETAVALYHLDKGRGIIRAVGGDVYYSLETYKDAYNVMHADGMVEAGNAVVVDTGEFTGIALYGPHDIRPLEEGQSPNGDGVRAAFKPDLEMHYGGGDDGRVVSVRIDGNMVDLPEGFRRSKEYSIRYAARELAYKELHKAAPEASPEPAAGKPAEKEPPCPEVEPHDGLQCYIKVLFRGCRWETDTGNPLPEHYGPNCYVLVPEDGRTVISGDEFMQDIVRIVNDWAAPYSLRSYKRSEVSAVTATDRMGRERVMPCDENGNALFYTVQFKGVHWMKDGKDYGGQDILEVRVPKTGPSLEIDGRAAGSVIGEAVLKAEKGQDATMYYRNVYFVC